MQADLGVQRDFDPQDRLFALELGGGALLDLGVYVVSFAQMLLGTPDTVAATGSRFPTGVDAEAALLLGYADGRVGDADDVAARRAAGAGAGVRHDRAGSTCSPASTTRRRSCCTATAPSPRRSPGRSAAAGYAHELEEVTTCLQQGRTESAVMPLADTLAVQDVLQSAADQLGVAHTEAPVDLAHVAGG